MSTTLVLIPGLLSDARVWRPLAEATPGSAVFHADATQDGSIEAMARRVLDNTSGPLIVVGHSMGARVAMEVARQAPDRVTHLVLSNTGHHPLKEGETEKRQAKIEQGHADFPGMVKGWLPPMMAASRHQDTDLIADLTEMALKIGPDVHERQINALIGRPDAGAYIPDVTCPILLLTGTEDVWSPEAQHREIQTMAPNADLHVVENAGHFLPVEQPEVTTRLITAWLASKEETFDE